MCLKTNLWPARELFTRALKDKAMSEIEEKAKEFLFKLKRTPMGVDLDPITLLDHELINCVDQSDGLVKELVRRWKFSLDTIEMQRRTIHRLMKGDHARSPSRRI